MRINLYGGPSTGKSLIAGYVFSLLKTQDVNIELISEYIKTWAYEKRQLQGCDQFYVFAKQWRKEDIILRNGVDHLITDSPLLLQCVYSKKYNAEGWEEILERALKIEQKTDIRHRSINILLQRDFGKYQEEGRWQDLNAAKEVDAYMASFLSEHKVDYICVPNDINIVYTEVCRLMRCYGISIPENRFVKTRKALEDLVEVCEKKSDFTDPIGTGFYEMIAAKQALAGDR